MSIFVVGFWWRREPKIFLFCSFSIQAFGIACYPYNRGTRCVSYAYGYFSWLRCAFGLDWRVLYVAISTLTAGIMANLWQNRPPTHLPCLLSLLNHYFSGNLARQSIIYQWKSNFEGVIEVSLDFWWRCSAFVENGSNLWIFAVLATCGICSLPSRAVLPMELARILEMYIFEILAPAVWSKNLQNVVAPFYHDLRMLRIQATWLHEKGTNLVLEH